MSADIFGSSFELSSDVFALGLDLAPIFAFMAPFVKIADGASTLLGLIS